VTDDREAFVATYGPLFEHSPWVAEAAYANGPYVDREALLDGFVAVLDAAPKERQIALVRAHPDLAGKAAIEGTLTEDSQREQASAGLDRLSPDEYRRFHALNDAYKARFGFPFIIAVREHTKESILRSFETRLGNDREAEVATALDQIARIVRLRLADAVAP
jgi:2-oxo-4-hydroxy-4-carboxy-5-ureidoimidazoline decarboxylase